MDSLWQQVSADTPTPPYYAVIFTSLLCNKAQVQKNIPDYGVTAEAMMALAAKQTGFLGVESAREIVGITVSYWQSLQAIQSWKLQVDHVAARNEGRDTWYQAFHVRIAKVEKAYDWQR